MLLIGNGLVFTCTEELGVISDGGVVIEREKIVAVGKTDQLKEQYPGASYKDAGGKVVMPGMINTHMHLYSTFARGMDLKTNAAPRNFLEILQQLWWRLDNRLNQADIYYSALAALLAGIKKGTTTIFDHHASFAVIDGSLDLIAEAVQQAGVRANLSYEVSDRQGRVKGQAALRENERFIKMIQAGAEQDYLGGRIGLHAAFTLEDQTLEQATALADQLGVPFHLHTAEGRIDQVDSRERGYQGVIDRLNQYRIWRPGTLAIHGVHLQREELQVLAETGSYLIHNPESNMGNAVGAAPVAEALREGVTVGLGTDGYTADLFASIKAANLLQKHRQGDPRVGGNEVRTMALLHNRQIASRCFQCELGSLRPGAAADLLLLDYSPPTPFTTANALSHLLFGLSGDQVDTTIVGGKVLMEGREVKVLDEEEISRKTREQAADFWQRF